MLIAKISLGTSGDFISFFICKSLEWQNCTQEPQRAILSAKISLVKFNIPNPRSRNVRDA